MRRLVRETLMLTPVLFRRPAEYYDRLTALIENQIEKLRKGPCYPLQTIEQATSNLSECLHAPLYDYFTEPGLREAQGIVREQMEKLAKGAPFARKHSADFSLAGMCYVLVRIFKPEILVETGVAYGVTTTFILKALEANQTGVLHSIDLPPSIEEGADQHVGAFVPETLKRRWELHLGASRRVLPLLLPRLQQVDFFMHDSLHTYRNMRSEYQWAQAYFGPHAVLISDDVQGNSAFLEWIETTKPTCWAVIQESEKPGAFGVGVLLDRGQVT